MRQRRPSSTTLHSVTGTTSISSFCGLLVAKLPISQKTMLGSLSSVSDRYCSRLTRAEKKPLMIMPVRISISRLRWMRRWLKTKISTRVTRPASRVLKNSP